MDFDIACSVKDSWCSSSVEILYVQLYPGWVGRFVVCDSCGGKIRQRISQRTVYIKGDQIYSTFTRKCLTDGFV